MGDNEESLIPRVKGWEYYQTYIPIPGRGTIEEEQDYTPGYRNGFAWINCKTVRKIRYRLQTRRSSLVCG